MNLRFDSFHKIYFKSKLVKYSYSIFLPKFFLAEITATGILVLTNLLLNFFYIAKWWTKEGDRVCSYGGLKLKGKMKTERPIKHVGR